MNILLLLLASFGLANIVVNGTILNAPRDWLSERSKFFKTLLICSLCVGFWTGVYFSILLLFVAVGSPLFYILTIPFASSGISWILERGGTILDHEAYKTEMEE